MKRRRQGVVLVIVLIVIVMLTLAVFTFTDLMLAERGSVKITGRQIQARAFVQSGVEYSKAFLSLDKEVQTEHGGSYDSPESFQAQLLIDAESPTERGRFSLIAPLLDDQGYPAGVRFGLENDSARLNVNALLLADEQQEDGGRLLLMALPGMTEDVADSILDWLDEDDEPRELGAELEYYSSLETPYHPKNGPLDTVEELLLIRGVTPQLLFGLDTNRNGMVDLHEQGGDLAVVEEGDNAELSLALGWAGFLTLYSQETNISPLGDQRVYLNAEDMQELHDDLTAVLADDWVNFIIAYRQNGPYVGSKEGESKKGGQLDLSRPGTIPMIQVLDLIGIKVQVTFEGDDEATILDSPFKEDLGAMNTYMPILFDHVTVNPAPTIPGRINVNLASRTVLLGIPGMTEEIVDQIISLRDKEPDEEKPNRRHESWLLTEAVVSLDDMRAMLPFVTTGGSVFRAHVVGYYDEGDVASRAEVILDTTEAIPRVVFWRDLEHLGRGFPLEILGVEASLDDDLAVGN